MATARITIGQAGAFGAAGKARDDLVLSQPVTLKNADNTGVVSWRWRMVTRPTGSAASLSNVAAASPTFTPDVRGSYLIELRVNGGASGEVTRTIAAVRNVAVTTLSYGDVETRFIAAGEADEANWSVGGSPNTTGWWEDLDRWLRVFDDFAGGAVPELTLVLAEGNITDGQDIIITTGDLLVADADGTVDLGTSLLKWNDIWLGGLLATPTGVEFTASSANPGGVPASTLYLDDGTNHPAGSLSWDGPFAADMIYADAIYLDGGLPANAIAAGAGVVIGDGTAPAGLTVFTGPTDAGGMYFTDTAGGASYQGAVLYLHNANAIYFYAGGGYRALVRSDGLHPNSDNTYDLGVNGTIRWRSGFFGTSVSSPLFKAADGSGAAAGTSLRVVAGAGGPTNGAGGTLGIYGGLSQGSGAPGGINLIAASAVSGNVAGANVIAYGGAGSGTEDGGAFYALGGTGGSTSGKGGPIILAAGASGATNGDGGNVQMTAGPGTGTGTPGEARVLGAAADTGGGANGGPVVLTAGAGDSAGTGGGIEVTTGDAGAGGVPGDMVVTSGAYGGAGTAGKLHLTDMGLEFTLQASKPGAPVTAGRGRFWARTDDMPMFTDSGNVDHLLAQMPAIQLYPATSFTVASGGFTAATLSSYFSERFLMYADAASDTGYWVERIPDDYAGQGLTLTIRYTGNVASTNSIQMRTGYTKYTANSTTLSGGSASFIGSQFGMTGPSSIRLSKSHTVAYTHAQLGSPSPGDLYQFFVRRYGADGSDLYAGQLWLQLASFSQP